MAPFRAALVEWYRRQRRDLPWRRTRDPYAIWVSEVMLQQTRVETVIPRWRRWVARFPSVGALATAPIDDVLAEWAGLGYYARARNLHRAAREVAERYGGQVPDDAEALRALPGVGRYTAGAVASIAFGRREAVLDGNVIRVLARAFAVDGDARGGPAQRRLWELAAELVASDDFDPGEVNQAAMELGATLCAPRQPSCLPCPAHPRCAARRTGRTAELPSLPRKTAPRAMERVTIALVRRPAGEVLLGRCPPSGLWGGLYELPAGEPVDDEDRLEAARRVAQERVGLTVESRALRPLLTFEHVLTHRRITFHAFVADVGGRGGRVRRHGYDAHAWVTPTDATSLGISTATSKLLAALQQELR